MKPTAYYLDEFDSNGELVDREYNGINEFCGGGFGKPLYTREQLEAAVLSEREACAKFVSDSRNNDEYGEFLAAAIRARTTT